MPCAKYKWPREQIWILFIKFTWNSSILNNSTCMPTGPRGQLNQKYIDCLDLSVRLAVMDEHYLAPGSSHSTNYCAISAWLQPRLRRITGASFRARAFMYICLSTEVGWREDAVMLGNNFSTTVDGIWCISRVSNTFINTNVPHCKPDRKKTLRNKRN